MPNYEVELIWSATIVVKDAENEEAAFALASGVASRAMTFEDHAIRLLKDEELDIAVSQADAVSQP